MQTKEIIGVMSFVATAYAWYCKWKPILLPVVKDVEKRALDGVIDKADRKAIAMTIIGSLEASGKIKLSFISRWILPHLVDYLANKLPNYEVSKEVMRLNPVVKK